VTWAHPLPILVGIERAGRPLPQRPRDCSGNPGWLIVEKGVSPAPAGAKDAVEERTWVDCGGLIGILTALYNRARTGEGIFLKTALFETAAYFMGQHMAYGALTDDPVPPMPARVSVWSIYRVFECTDGPIFIGIISEKHWKAFCGAFDREDWLADPRLGTNNDRISEREWLHPAVAEMIAKYPRAEVSARLDKASVPFFPIARPEDLYDDPQLNDGLGLLETTLPAGVTAKPPRIPLEMGDHDFALRRDPPQIGEDTTDLLKDLGDDEDQIAKLVEEGVVAVED